MYGRLPFHEIIKNTELIEKNELTCLTHLVKRVKQVLFRVENINLNLTHLIKRVERFNPFN